MMMKSNCYGKSVFVLYLLAHPLYAKYTPKHADVVTTPKYECEIKKKVFLVKDKNACEKLKETYKKK